MPQLPVNSASGCGITTMPLKSPRFNRRRANQIDRFAQIDAEGQYGTPTNCSWRSVEPRNRGENWDTHGFTQNLSKPLHFQFSAACPTKITQLKRNDRSRPKFDSFSGTNSWVSRIPLVFRCHPSTSQKTSGGPRPSWPMLRRIPGITTAIAEMGLDRGGRVW